jgi:hypothetical protein
MASAAPLDLTTGVASSHPDRFQNAPRVAEAPSTQARDAVTLEAGTRLQALHREVDEAELRVHASVYASLQTVAVNLVDGLGEIARNRDLSPGGKARAKKEAAKLALKAADNFTTNAKKLREDVRAADEGFAQAGAQLRPANVPEAEWERRVAQAREQLARNLTDPLEVWNAYLGAPDPVALAAFESLGTIFDRHTKQLVPALDLERVREKQAERGRASWPEVVANRDKNERLASTYASAAQLITSQVREAVDERTIEVL